MSNDWRAARNLRALDRLMQGRHQRFPESVWRHAVTRPLVPATLTRAVESYWRHHPLRADRLARALAARSGAPEGWSWQVGRQSLEGSSATFRSLLPINPNGGRGELRALGGGKHDEWNQHLTAQLAGALPEARGSMTAATVEGSLGSLNGMRREWPT